MNPAALRAAAAGRARFTVLCLGADHFAALAAAWPEEGGLLHVISVLADGPLPGMQRQLQANPRLRHDLLVMPAWQALGQLRTAFDAVVLDTPAGHDWCRPLARLCQPGALLQAQGLNAVQRHGLEGQGFVFQTEAEAVYSSRKPAQAQRQPVRREAIVLGAGVAGCAVAERLAARGWQISLLEQHAAPAQEASGNLAGIFMPILSKDDAVPTRLTRAAYLFALRHWEQLGGIGRAFLGAQCGVLHLARDADHAATQRAIAARWHYPADYAEWLERPALAARLGRDVADGAWWFPRAGWARPSSICGALLQKAGPHLQARFGCGPLQAETDGSQWQVRNSAGELLATAPLLVLASGALATPWTARLPLARIRGQVSHLDAAHAPGLPMVVCGEAYVTPLHDGISCAGASYDESEQSSLSAASHADNLARAGAMLGCDLSGAPLAGRVGFRSVAPDRLPLVGALPAGAQPARLERLRDVQRQPGLYGLLGLASRGIIWAPLMAELLAAELEGEAPPLESSLAEALDPARFLLRARRKDADGPDLGVC